jgi:hypothetical protein
MALLRRAAALREFGKKKSRGHEKTTEVAALLPLWERWRWSVHCLRLTRSKSTGGTAAGPFQVTGMHGFGQAFSPNGQVHQLSRINPYIECYDRKY